MNTGHLVHTYSHCVCVVCVWSTVPLPPTTIPASLGFSYAFSPSTFHMQMHAYTRHTHAQMHAERRTRKVRRAARLSSEAAHANGSRDLFFHM